MTETKKWFASKTVMTGIAGLAYAIGGYYTGQLDITQAALAVQIALSAIFLRVGSKNLTS